MGKLSKIFDSVISRSVITIGYTFYKVTKYFNRIGSYCVIIETYSQKNIYILFYCHTIGCRAIA